MRTAATAALALTFAMTGGALADMGPLAGILPENGSDGTWAFRTDEAGFHLTNSADATALKYLYIDTLDEMDGKRQISTTVEVETLTGTGNAFAGLVFSFDPDESFFYLSVLTPDGEFALYERSAEGFAAKVQGKAETFRPGANTLGLAEDGKKISLTLNGEELLNVENVRTGTGGIGIAAAGLVRASFTDFTLDLAP